MSEAKAIKAAKRRERKKMKRKEKRKVAAAVAKSAGVSRPPRQRRRAGRLPTASQTMNSASMGGGGKYFRKGYGRDLGGILGEGVQGIMDAIGFGDYRIKRNSLISHINTGTDPPTVRNNFRGEGTVIHHREFIGNLKSGTFRSGTTATEFTKFAYPINIGNSNLFPWGSTTSVNFQEWEPSGILVELKTTSSNATLDLAMGAMFCAVDYNSLDPAPSSKRELENMEYAMSQKPSSSIVMPVECARQNTPLTHLYISRDLDYQGGDQRLYNLGVLYVGSEGIPAEEADIAEIWITYDITLFKPILGSEFLVEAAIIDSSTNTNDFPFTNGVVRYDPHGFIAETNLTSFSFEISPHGYGKCFMMIVNNGATLSGATISPLLDLSISGGIDYIFACQMSGSAPDVNSAAYCYPSGADRPCIMLNTVGFVMFRVPDTPTAQVVVSIVDWDTPNTGSANVGNMFLLRIPDFEQESQTGELHAKLAARSANRACRVGRALPPQRPSTTKAFASKPFTNQSLKTERGDEKRKQTLKKLRAEQETQPVDVITKTLPAEISGEKPGLKEMDDPSSTSSSDDDGGMVIRTCPATHVKIPDTYVTTKCFRKMAWYGHRYRTLSSVMSSGCLDGGSTTSEQERKRKLEKLRGKAIANFGPEFTARLFGTPTNG